MRSIKLALLLSLLTQPVWAGDYHQNDQRHRLAYVIATAAADIPVTGQTVTLAIERASDSKFYDFTDSTFKSSGWTTRTTTLSYDVTGEYYYKDLIINRGSLISDEVCAIISNDNATYHDRQVDCYDIDTTAQLIRINR